MLQMVGLRADEEIWKEFVAVVKTQHRTIWSVISPFIKQYIKDNKHKKI